MALEEITRLYFLYIIYSIFNEQTIFSDTDPSKIGHGQPTEMKTKWGEANQFGGSETLTAQITVRAFFN